MMGSTKSPVELNQTWVSFEEAQTVFVDEHARLLDDPGHSEHEQRFVSPGYSFRARSPVVIYCYRGLTQ